MMERDRITGFYFIWGSVEVIGLSQHHTIFTPLLRSECGPHQATCYDFYPPWPKSYELVPGQCTGRAGGNYGEQRRAATLHQANINNTVYTSSANKVCSPSLGCSMLQYWIWISWPSTAHRLLNCFSSNFLHWTDIFMRKLLGLIRHALRYDHYKREQRFGVWQCLVGLWLTFDSNN